MRKTAIIVTLASLVVLTALCTMASAGDYGNGCPYSNFYNGTLENGGGIYFDVKGYYDNEGATQSYTFENVPDGRQVVRMYPGIWLGSPYLGRVTEWSIEINGHTDHFNFTEPALPFCDLDCPPEDGTGEHCTVSCSGYGVCSVTYNASPYVVTGDNDVTYWTSEQIYQVGLLAVYENASMEKLQYWVKEGHEYPDTAPYHVYFNETGNTGPIDTGNISAVEYYTYGYPHCPGESGWPDLNIDYIGSPNITKTNGIAPILYGWTDIPPAYIDAPSNCFVYPTLGNDRMMVPVLGIHYSEDSGDEDLEFGDAPDPTYPSLLASDGARHIPTGTEFLGLQSTGDGKDFEPDANIIDADFLDDGLLTFALTTGNPAQTMDFEVTNLIAGDQTLIVNILLDLNGDGDWNDSVGTQSEHVVQNQSIPLTGIAEGTFTSDPFSTVGATAGLTWMRITLTRHTINTGWDGTMASAGYAEAFECGETEDWLVELQELVPPTPFLISGEVDYDTGEPVPDPAVTIENTNTSESFVVNISGNEYQITTDSTHVGAGDVLHFNASNGNVTKFNRTVISEEMNAGGFVQNITIVQSTVSLPDLIVESVSINPDCNHYYFANEPNVLDVTVKNVGTAAAGISNASVSGTSGTSVAAVGALNPGESQTVTITDPVARPAGEVVTAIADCYGEVTESNEMNNTSSIIDPDGNNHVINHGLKGKWLAEGYAGPDPGNMTTWKSYELHGDLNYSVGDSYYISGYANWGTYNASWTAGDLPIPDSATDVVEARLYVYYTWDKAWVMPDNVSTSFNGVNQAYDVHYTDRKGYASYNLPYGALVYNVTGDFNTGGNYANVTKLIASSNQVSMRGMMLVVVYEDPNEPLRQIFVIEEYDNLYGMASYCTTPEEATARALFTGPSIDMGTMVNASLITVASGAGPNEGDLIFNGQTWTDVWNFAGTNGTELGIDERDVASYLESTDNAVGFQSNGDWMEASNAFLVVEYSEQTGTCGDVDGTLGVTTHDGWFIYMNQTFPGDPTYFVNTACADCDGNLGVTTHDGWFIYMNQTFPGDPRYMPTCTGC